MITLNGAATLQHEQGTTYTDLGATATDAIDDDATLTAAIVQTGTVDSNTPGTYVLTYDVSDAAGNAATQVTRTVNVTDTTAPIITLLGSDPIDHEVDTLYNDAGATATDNIDGLISNNIGVTGSVNASVIGTYTLTYNVQDSSGNAATTVTRTVNVVDTGAPTITLIGDNPLLHELQTPFTDPGATAFDAADGDLGSVTGVGIVDTNVVGTYTLTYDIQDSQSNAAPTVTRTVNVADRTAPVITLNGAATLQHEQGTTYTDLGATATDNIDGSVTVSTTSTVNEVVPGTYSVTYNATDSAGNNATTVVRTVTVSDTTAPVITITGENPKTHEVGTVYVDEGATATDNIDDNATLTSRISVTGSVNASTKGTYILSYNVADDSGNAATTVTRTVNVVDTGAPVITVNGANPLNHELNTPFTDPGATASDLIDGPVAVTVSGDTVDPNTQGTYTILYDAQDSESNAANQRSRTVNVGDFTAPIITLNGTSTTYHEQLTPYSDAGATASDNIDDNAALTASIVKTGSVAANSAGTYLLSYNVSDSAGNAATTMVRTVIVEDTTIPTLSLNGTATVNHEQGTTYIDQGAAASDNVDGNITNDVLVSSTVNETTAGTYTVTYNVSDSSGNAASTLIRTVIVEDTLAPAITLNGSSSINHEQGTTYTDLGATATDIAEGDLSGSISVTNNVNSTVAGTYTVSYDVTDSVGNIATTVTRTVTVLDTTPPLITLNGASTVNVEQGTSYVDLGAAASDSVDGNLTSSIIVSNPVDVNIAGTYTVTYNVSDSSLNDATPVTRTVIVSDTTPPVITLLGQTTVNVQQGTSYTDAGATALDSVEGSLTSSIVTNNPVDANVAGSYTVSYNVSDSSGNAALEVSRTVIVADSIAPVLSLVGAASVTVEQGTSYSELGATATDNIDDDTALTATISITGDTVDANTAGTYIVQYDVSDSSGNAASPLTRTVIVQDTIAPVITLAGSTPITIERGAAYSDAGATASDNIDGNISANIITTGSVNTLVSGSYAINYNVTDTAGNAAIQVQRTVNVVDTINPTITLTGAPSVNHEQGTSYTDLGATAEDLPGEDISGNVVIGGDTVNGSTLAGTYTITYNANDAAGNPANQVTRTVTVADTTAPIITLTGASTVNVEQGTSYTDAGATATDLVDGSVAVTVGGDTVDPATAGTYILTYDAVDAATNSATQVTRTVIVADTTIPVITLAGDTNIDIAVGDLFVDPGYSATDNIDDDVTLTGNVTVSGVVDINTVGTYVLSYDVSDTAGNNAVTQTRTVNVVTPVVVSFEAETATISGSHTVASANTGFTGSGYIQHSGEGYVEYTFDAFELPYDLVVRYAWDTGDRPLEVILNGASLGTLSFPATGSLTTWLNTASFALTPLSGSNTLRLQTTGSSGANLDSISLTPQ